MKIRTVLLIALIFVVLAFWTLSFYRYYAPCDEHKVVVCELPNGIIMNSEVECYRNECGDTKRVFILAGVMTVIAGVTFVLTREGLDE